MIRAIIYLILLLGCASVGIRFVKGWDGPVADLRRPVAAPGAATIEVHANAVDVYGQPWHGISNTGFGMGGLMALSLPTTLPPSLDLCVVSIDGDRTRLACNARPSTNGLAAYSSACPFSPDCAWSVVLPHEPYALVAIDLTLFGADDANTLVDTLIVAEPGQDTDAIEAVTRRILPRLARTRIALPSWLHLGTNAVVALVEEARRSKPFAVVDRNGCSGQSGCALDQSVFFVAEAAKPAS